MAEVSFTITGGDEIVRALKEKVPEISREAMRESLSDAAGPWRDEMIALVHRGPHHARGGGDTEYGVVAANIEVSTKSEGDYAGEVRVGPDQKIFWARFLEFGTRSREARGGKHAHHATKAYPFMRPAFEARKQEVLDRFVADLRSRLNTLGLR